MASPKALKFGWKSNSNADGFEQEHGRFTMEVFWSDPKRAWAWAVWADVSINGVATPSIIDQGISGTRLEDAKRDVLKRAAALERDMIEEDTRLR